MNAATRAVIERLIEASIDSAFKWSATEEESAKLESAIAEARKLLEDDDWIRVEDALPVVPEGARYVEVWISHSRLGIERERWLGRSNRFDDDGATTHWRYAEQEPQPPKQYWEMMERVKERHLAALQQKGDTNADV